MAASNSVRKEMGARNGRGQSSVRKTATPSANGTAMHKARSDVARVPKMKGSAPKSPETGSHAERVKNFQPNCTRLGRECKTRMPKMKRTMAKIVQAQTSMTAAKLLSAMRPLPRLRRKSRIGEGGGSIAANAGSGRWTAGGLGRMGDIGCDGL